MTNPDEREDVSSAKPEASTESEDAASPHDALFYKTFSQPEHAAAELKNILSPALVEKIDWSSLRLESLKFVDAKLTSRYSDVLFSASVGEKRTYFYVLYEHESDGKTWALLQILRYQTRIWDREADKPLQPGPKRLPPIVTVILHHSERGWSGSVRFRDYFDLDEELSALFAPYLLDFGVLIDDISKVSGGALAKRPITPEGQLVLFALRFGRTPDRLIEELPNIAQVLVTLLHRPSGELVIASFIVYVKTVGKVRESEVRMALQQTVGNTLAEEIMYAGELQFARGKLEGTADGERKIVLRLLGQRFGKLPADVIARIEAATSSNLEAMALRVLSAATLDEVLDALPPRN